MTGARGKKMMSTSYNRRLPRQPIRGRAFEIFAPRWRDFELLTGLVAKNTGESVEV